MSVLRIISGALEDGMRRAAVYGADLLVFEEVSPMEEPRAFADSTPTA